jgi:hypothetical protein
MYGNKQHVELFNSTAGAFFGMHQLRLHETCALALARIFDPPQTMGHSNLTLYTLLNLLKEHDKNANIAPLRAETDSIMTLIAPLRTMRHKKLAHLDQATLLAQTLPTPFTTGEYTTALDRVEQLLNDIGSKFGHAPIMFNSLTMEAGADVKQLVYRLMASADITKGQLGTSVMEYQANHPDS